MSIFKDLCRKHSQNDKVDAMLAHWRKQQQGTLNGRNEENTGTNLSALAAATMSTTLSEILETLKLEKYIDALLEAGYEDLGCFDFECTTFEEMLKELIEDVPMKKPPARKLLVHLRKQKQETLNEQQEQGHVQDENIDVNNLPIAHEVVSVGSSTAASSVFDFAVEQIQQSSYMEKNHKLKILASLLEDAQLTIARKEQENIQVARMMDERAAAMKKEMEQKYIARMMDEHAAIAASLNVPRRLVSNAAMAERNKRKVATSTGERKEQSGEEQSGKEQTRTHLDQWYISF